MREIVRTNDPVTISAIGALFDAAEIHYLVLDQNISVMEGSIGIFQRRIPVGDDEVAQARQLLAEAGLGHELRGDERA